MEFQHARLHPDERIARKAFRATGLDEERTVRQAAMIDDGILKNFGRIWPAHVAQLTQFLIECRRHFDGDIDLLLVLCVIGDRTFSQRHAPAELQYEDWSSGKVERVPVEDINVQSLSDFSGIPRESVRRKLNTLSDKGWVVRNERGYITATDKARVDLEPLTLSSLKYLSGMKAVLIETSSPDDASQS